METAVKQRLVGAVILVVLIVLIVPELLRGRAPPSASSSHAARVPEAASPASGDAPLRSVTIDLTDNAMAPAVAATETPAPSVAAPPTSQAPAASAREPAPAPPPQPMSPSAVAPPTPTPASAAMPFAVQVGTFSLRVSADRQSRVLQGLGYSAYVAPVTRNGRELYRVRIGPMPDRGAANEVLRKVRAAGKDAAIVANP